MGTPEFALSSLQSLIASAEHKIQAVFTAAPKKQGRGMSLTNSPVHDLALRHDIPVFTPSSLRNEQINALIASIEADIIVVVAYGFIIPKAILTAKKYGCLNIHPSNLPKYRGAAPLQRTIINGDKETAVCVMQMDEGLDTGDILAQENFVIPDDCTLQELHDQCAKIGSKLLLHVLENINVIAPIKQSEEGLSYAHKLQKEEGQINWSQEAAVNERKIRGMNPWPGAYFFHQGKQVKILQAKAMQVSGDYGNGDIIDHNICLIACAANSALELITVKPEGKGAMSGASYLRGLQDKPQNL
jgi:methionyl-tRNA formyltransferase